ncbi:MAG: hypothetical protein WC359_14720 [Dehalococcoidia bacterium]|jgi:hypothetical protein
MNIQTEANRIARQAGHVRANRIVVGDRAKVVKHIAYGYRKYTTGEYVSTKYRSCFGWKNTYYQHAITTVMLRDPRSEFSGVDANFVSAT